MGEVEFDNGAWDGISRERSAVDDDDDDDDDDTSRTTMWGGADWWRTTPLRSSKW